MTCARLLTCSSLLLAIGLVVPTSSHAQQADKLDPYKMLRSLQFVQDSVVSGDHSAAEMQRFMLATLDERLRSADNAVFEDPRNVDAALIYAMSGGNPATLEFLVARDIDGNFDNRVTDVLRKYLSGKGTLIAKTLSDMVPEYRDKKIGAYLALVAGNITVSRDPKAALKFYDWARLVAPGTIVEEAALRRSLAVAIDAKMLEPAMRYAKSYARRFLHSPYASQFADLYVQLCVEHYDEMASADIDATLAFMDNDRQQEVYLRLARKAAILGKNGLATLAADRARVLAGLDNANASALASLYGGLAGIPTNNVNSALTAISGVPDAMLTPSDRALRAAARAVADAVVRPPVAESPAQDPLANLLDTQQQADAADADLQQSVAPVPDITPVAVPNAGGNAPPDVDPQFRTFVDGGRTKLDAIDKLLNDEGPSK